MVQIERLMDVQSEERVAEVILEQVRKNNMTISNLKNVTDKVVNYLESNATLGMEDSAITESPKH